LGELLGDIFLPRSNIGSGKRANGGKRLPKKERKLGINSQEKKTSDIAQRYGDDREKPLTSVARSLRRG